MDFKVAGTAQGVTALQMDIKIEGLSREILEEALQQAKVGRMQILNHMLGTIAETREDLSAYAPKIKVMTKQFDDFNIEALKLENSYNVSESIAEELIASIKDFKATLFIENLNIKSIDKDYEVNNIELNLENID